MADCGDRAQIALDLEGRRVAFVVNAESSADIQYVADQAVSTLTALGADCDRAATIDAIIDGIEPRL